MHRASNAFSVLQATAATVGIAILLWSVGLPSLRFAEAASVTNFSDTLSTSAPSIDANHTIVFTTPSGIASGETIVLTFEAPFNPASVDHTDIDVATSSGEFSLAADCTGSELASAAFAGDVLTITMCEPGSNIAPNGTTTIEIGTHATFQTTGDQAINNPATAGQSYEIQLAAGSQDTGETRVAIVNTVEVTASVDTLFNFTVGGVATGGTVSATTTTGSTTAQLIPFGELEAGVASTAAQSLTVVTNARNGFVVTVQTDQQLSSENGADIDGFRNGNYDTVDVPWESPASNVGDEDTWGHWGLTSDDTDYFAAGSYVSASTTPVEIFAHNGPIDGTTLGQGTVNVGYTVEVSSLQEAATDYQAVLTYIATPVF